MLTAGYKTLIPSAVTVCAVLLCSLGSAAIAGPSWQTDNWQVRVGGYGTLGVTTSDSDVLGFRRELSQRDAVFEGDVEFRNDSLISAQISASYRDRFTAVLQGKSRYTYRGLDTHINVALAQLRLTPTLTVRAGRLPHDAYLFSESRDVGFSYLWARPSVEYYGALLLDHYDGVDVSYRWRRNDAVWQWRLAGGEFQTRSLYGGPIIFFTDYRDMISASLIYEGRTWKWRIGHIRSTINNSFMGGSEKVLQEVLPVLSQVPPEFFNFATRDNLEGVELTQTAASVGYRAGNWTVQSELAMLRFQRYFYSANLGVGYEMGRFTPYVQWGRLYGQSRGVPSSISTISPEVDKIIGRYVNIVTNDANQSAVSLGLRWDIRPTVALKLQWDKRWVREDKSYLWLERTGGGHSRHINTVSLQMDFVF